MIRKATELMDYTIRARDGDVGSVIDLYFDDDSWTVRYFVVDTGGWIAGRQVLISPESLENPDWPVKQLPANLTREQVESAPGIDTALPVSRQVEAHYRSYYAWPPYWGGVVSAPPVAVANPPQEAQGLNNDETPSEAEARQQQEATADPHLRSFREVDRYRVQCSDGEAGHVEDFLIDDQDWAIRYLVIDTRSWLPAKDVLIPSKGVMSILWNEKKIVFDIPKALIQEAPEYDDSRPLGRDYEERLYDHYGWSRYWAA